MERLLDRCEVAKTTVRATDKGMAHSAGDSRRLRRHSDGPEEAKYPTAAVGYYSSRIPGDFFNILELRRQRRRTMLQFSPGTATIFVGPSNSGKSLVLKEIERYVQTDDPETNFRDGLITVRCNTSTLPAAVCLPWPKRFGERFPRE